jgi:hypothetical protein
MIVKQTSQLIKKNDQENAANQILTLWYFEHRKIFQGFKIHYDTSSKCHMTPLQNNI